MFGEADLEAMLRLRAAFDPERTCNPGKISDHALLRRVEPEGARLRPGAVRATSLGAPGPSHRRWRSAGARRELSWASSKLARCATPIAVDGVPVGDARAAGREALAAALVALGEARCAAIPRGAGTQLGSATSRAAPTASSRSRRSRASTSSTRAKGYVTPAPGRRSRSCARACPRSGWELPLDDAGRGGTSAARWPRRVAPRALGFGRPRDVVLGREVVLADGLRTRCGGRVVKNVTGYDLAKLYTGSLGALGVITGAWLRLRPRPGPCACSRATISPTRRVPLGIERRAFPPRGSCLLSDETGGLRATRGARGRRRERRARRRAPRRERPAPRHSARCAMRAATRRYAGLPGTLRFVVSSLPTRAGPSSRCCAGRERSCSCCPALGLVCARAPASSADCAIRRRARGGAAGSRALSLRARPARSQARPRRVRRAAPRGCALATR